jgi:hypothetical protein
MGRDRSTRRSALGVLVVVLVIGAITASAAWASGSPFVETKPARSVNKTEALLNGVVNPNGAETKYYFEYGTTVAYGKKTAEVSVGSGTSNLEESKVIASLTAGTTYHFRVVAKNSNGTSDGADAQFTTLSEESGCHIKPGSKSFGLCVEGSPVAAAPTELKQIKGQPVELDAKSISLGIICNNVGATGEFVVSGALLLKEGITLSNCALEGTLKEKCKIPGTNEFYPTQGAFGNNPENVTVKPVGEKFFTLVILNKNECPLTVIGNWPVTGHYQCKLSEAEVEKTQHKEVCEGEGLELLEAPTTITYYVNVALSEAYKEKKFSIYEH